MLPVILFFLVGASVGCTSDEQPQTRDAGSEADAEPVDLTDVPDLGEDSNDMHDSRIDPFSPPYPYPSGYLCDSPGLHQGDSPQSTFQIPQPSQTNPGPAVVSELSQDDEFVVSWLPPLSTTFEIFHAIWREQSSEELTMHFGVWMGRDYNIDQVTYQFFIDLEPIEGPITFWDAERETILGQSEQNHITAPYVLGEYVIADITIPSRQIKTDRVQELTMVEVHENESIYRSQVFGVSFLNGTLSQPAHPCFEKTQTPDEFALGLSEKQRRAMEEQKAIGSQPLHLLMFTESNLDDPASGTKKEVFVGEQSKVTVHVLGYPTLGAYEGAEWSAEALIPVLNNVPLEQTWYVAFPVVRGTSPSTYLPVWATSFDVDLPPGDSTLQILAIDDPFLTKMAPDGRVREDGRFVTFPSSNMLLFKR